MTPLINFQLIHWILSLDKSFPLKKIVISFRKIKGFAWLL